MTNKEKTPTAIEVQAQTNTEIIPQETQVVNDYDIDAFLDKRKEFIEKVNKIMVKGSDYHEIQGKKSLAKGGAEKIASIFGWTAEFEKDTDVLEAFKIDGLIAYTCNLRKSGGAVGQGRGAATLGKNAGDPNKTIKMAQKSAFIDAVLRSSGLSDFFTQDLGPEDEGAKYNHVKDNDFQGAPAKARPASNKQQSYIRALLDQKGVKDVTNKQIEALTSEQAKKWIDKLLAMKDYEIGDGVDYNKPPFETPEIKAEVVERGDYPA